MKRYHEKRSANVSEPVQVYLGRSERARLSRLAELLDTTKSEVLRKGLEALERQLDDPDDHPALRIIGIAAKTVSPEPYDVAREHDRFITDSETKSWKPRRRSKRAR